MMKIVEEYIQFIKDKNTKKTPFIINKDWEEQLQEDKLKSIRFIVVGDNPGNNEKKEERYFIGRSGKFLRNFFLKNFGITSEEFIIFNKTPIYTSNTKGLSDIEFKILEESMIKSAEVIAKLSIEIQKPILIFGKTSISTTFLPFIKKLQEFDCKVFLFSHPSYGNLSIEYYDYTKKDYSNLDTFFKLGEENINKINLA